MGKLNLEDSVPTYLKFTGSGTNPVPLAVRSLTHEVAQYPSLHPHYLCLLLHRMHTSSPVRKNISFSDQAYPRLVGQPIKRCHTAIAVPCSVGYGYIIAPAIYKAIRMYPIGAGQGAAQESG